MHDLRARGSLICSPESPINIVQGTVEIHEVFGKKPRKLHLTHQENKFFGCEPENELAKFDDPPIYVIQIM